MGQKYFLTVLLLLFISLTSFSQSVGDIAFTGFNSNGDDDFSIVALADISASTTIYIKDGSGFIIWDTGSSIIKAGTIIIFTDVDSTSNPLLGVSVGSITKSGTFNWSASGETVFIYLGTDENTPTTYITGIKNADLNAGELDATGLTAGVNFLEFNSTSNPDGGAFNGSRSNQASYSSYLAILTNKANWASETSDGESLLPFSQEAFTINTTNWTGTTSAIWNLAGNWDNGIPTSSSKVTIPSVSTSPVINTDAVVGNLTIESSGTLAINSGKSLTMTGSLNINSGGSLIVQGDITGNITYNRALSTNNWYLISSPVVGETLQDLITNHTFANGTGSNIGIAPYANDGSAWNYQTTASTGTMNSGVGYSIKLASSGTLTFIGNMPTDDVAIAITDGTANKFNLIGNPYPSYIPANSNADGTNNILTINSAQLSEQTLWFWNQGTNAYITVNQASGSRFIAPAQGFFVNAKTGGGTFNFTEAMQSHQTTEVFNKPANSRFKINLQVANSSGIKASDIYYINGTTTGFDNGYDSSVFGGISSNFSLYTHLISDDTGKNLAIQSLPNSNYENMVIPVGLKADAGVVTFKVATENIPNGYHIYLEDRTTNTVTQLDKADAKYTVTLTNATDGIGRFYLYTTAGKPLATETVDLQNISLYKTNHNSIKITGLRQGKVSFSLINILGKRLVNKTFTTNGASEISLPKLANGIYIVQLQTATGKLNKKIIIE